MAAIGCTRRIDLEEIRATRPRRKRTESHCCSPHRRDDDLRGDGGHPEDYGRVADDMSRSVIIGVRRVGLETAPRSWARPHGAGTLPEPSQ